MLFTYYGHASFLLETAGKKLLFDPFISPNPLTEGIIKVDDIECDYILISHGHADHIADAVEIAKRTGAKCICNWEVYEWLQKQGIENVHPMNTGGKWNFDFGTVKCVVAQHSSSLPDGSYGGNPMGFIVQSHGKEIYYSGDTAVTMDMQLIPRWAQLDIAIFPIGDNFTMDAHDATMAADFCKVEKVIGVHFDTFGFIKIDHAAAKKTFEDAGLELIIPEIGSHLEI